jgi:hypothetical protein
MNNTTKLLHNFFSINSVLFSWIFINENSIFPLEDIFPMMLIFFSILAIQLIIIKYLKIINKILYLLFSSGNLIYFNLILNGEDNLTNLIILSIFVFFFIIILNLKKISYLYVFCFFFLTTYVIKRVYDLQKINRNEQLESLSIDNKNKNERNIFFIGIDGMISSEMYKYVFNTKSEAISKLDSLNFKILNFTSAGESTLETYAKLFTYKKVLHPRVYLQSINSKTSKFNYESRLTGYKKQFIFFSNYFGGNPNEIFDSYYPNQISGLNFTNFIDDRWGWYSVRAIKLLIKNEKKEFNYFNQMDNIKKRINELNTQKEKWICIAHLWYPGHTNGNYSVLDSTQFKNYKNYYKQSQGNLSNFFESITKNILMKDPKAIIVFWGDHGAYFFKGAESIDRKLFIKDKTNVTLAVYPKNYLSKLDIVKLQSNPEKLFKIILNTENNINK